jgi:hypothetical protein
MYSERRGELLTRYIPSGSVIIREQLRLVSDEINTKIYSILCQ